MRLSSLAFAHRMHFLFLVLQSLPCSPCPRLGTSLSLSSMVRFIFLEILVPSLIDFLRMLTSSHPPPSLLRSRNDFSTSVAVRIALFDLSCLVLVDDHAPLSPGSGLGHLVDLLLSCSEFLFISFDFLAFGVRPVLFKYCHCLRRYLRMSFPCVLLSVFMLRSRQLLCPLQLEL